MRELRRKQKIWREFEGITRGGFSLDFLYELRHRAVANVVGSEARLGTD